MGHHRHARHAAVLGLLALCCLPVIGDEKPQKESCVPKVIAEFTAKVVGVSDGDTITVLTDEKKQVKVRLEGIDAPESGQTNGSKAKQALSDLVFGKTLVVKKTGEDRYKRTLALLYLDGKLINDEMVKEGWAWQFDKYNCEDRVEKLETEAREAKRGLWATPNPIPPWEFRDRRNPVAKKPTPVEPEKTAPATRYWLNTNSNIRHNSSCEWFNNTKKGRFCGPNDGRGCKVCGG